ncbi:LacI family DNA-binding transcriptional regulator [uncultured Sphaerochaeta sp.]|uniref:LacI family DNA-binding transcriptional regulator n=1 Tax=uncultured Sphaerochaeta sp. TaxID=886478 RepID=UPI002A0A9AD1|nr:LacI family DNA-binding transcriptional regulator [uncultured Sphaerochaeta sp.]
MAVSIKEVAKLAGVSVATVSNVLNDTKNVRSETKEKVEIAVKQLNYRINPLARNFRKGQSKVIGFVVSDLSNYFFQNVAIGLEQSLASYGYHVALMDSKESKANEIENVRNLLASSVDGLVLAISGEDCSYLHLILENHDVPVVFVDRKPLGFTSDMVLSTNMEGAYLGVKQLIQKGHEKIGFLTSRNDSTMKERIDGYRQAHSEAGLKVNENYIMTGDNSVSISQSQLLHGISYTQTRELIEGGEVTALFAGNNLSSIGVYNYLREANIRVPEEIAFMTFDDSFWLSMTTPSISAVKQDPDTIGSVAGQLVYERISDKTNSQPDKIVRIPTRLVLRHSM